MRIDNKELPNWQKLEIDNILEEHNNGTANYIEWKDVKERLFTKYNVK